MVALARAPWPGNARQLRNTLERLVVAHPEARVTATDLLPLLEGQVAPPEPPGGAGPAVISAAVSSPGNGGAEPAGERERVVEALVRAGHVQTRAARLLGLTVRQLRYRVAKYGIKVERF